MSRGTESHDGRVVEVEFAVTAPAYPFVSIAREEDCRMVLEKQLPRGDGLQAEYFSVHDAPTAGVLDTADCDACHSANVLADGEGRCLVEFVVGEGCPARYLAERGAVPTTVEGTPDGGTIVAEIMPRHDPGEIVTAFERDHAVELVAKRARDRPTPLLSEGELQASVLDRLTDRQREVLHAAFEAGYYERPRRKTGEEIAEELDISPTTFQQHVRAAERKLVTFLVET
ncbi:Bacterio-opsin activator HTH domain protein [Salinarchaeum sp. Harcht-Bsk1]|uniref:helix-turn-helix domain-containing protein n=1 Tax=Salinarchaeum sp. Harcht-Bsk1 TaxID=1333523 RepID=UPI0003423D0B|nr:bacterio-opsin activator domain-containing protein [Salinarchaeum sp. Harcht-Bsk1]AGN01007.1 Bacterio-opsin activator HTH domain protein [Salinarchaeum sp. Harcht-Bsk1]